MLRVIPIFAILAGLAVGAPMATAQDETAAPAAGDAMAQETVPDEVAPDEAVPEGAVPDTQFDLGTPEAEAGPQPGEPYVREVFGDWSLRCVRASDGPDPCQMYQILTNEDGSPVAEVAIIPLAPGGRAEAGVTVVVPLMTQLTEQLSLSIDGGPAQRYPYDFCNPAGCVARFGLAPEQVAEFKSGSVGNLSIVPVVAPDQRINLQMSLAGFTAGFTATQTLPE